MVIGGVIAVVAIAGVLPMIVESISKRLPAIIRAWNEARDLRHRRKMQNKLLQAVADGNENAKEALRLQAISPDLPAGRRLPDDVLKQQWALPKSPPKRPGRHFWIRSQPCPRAAADPETPSACPASGRRDLRAGTR
jgi:hypothetical protein